MCASQYTPVDMLMYYDAHPCCMNGLFCTDWVCENLKGYYPFRMFNELYKKEHSVSIKTETINGKITAKTVFLLIGSMLSNGTTMLLQVLYKTYVPTGSVLVYSFLQFAITAIILLIFASFLIKQEKSTFLFPIKSL